MITALGPLVIRASPARLSGRSVSPDRCEAMIDRPLRASIRRLVGAEILLSVTGNECAAPMMLLRERDVLLSAVGSGLALVVLARARLTGLPSVLEPVVIGGS